MANYIGKAFKDAWKLCSDKPDSESRKKFEESTTLTKLLAVTMSLGGIFVIIVPIYLLCKYAFGIELGMWFLDWHIAVFCLVLGLIGLSAKNPIFILIAMVILGYGIYLVDKNSPYPIRKGESVFLEFLSMGKSSSYSSITIGESFCAFREYQGNTCKNYIHYVMGKEYAQAEKESKKILKEKELEAIKQTEKEIKENTLSRRFRNITSSYKGGENE